MRELRIADRRRSEWCETASPANRYVPAVGVSRQPRMFKIEDLPDPEAPRMVTNWPAGITKDTSRSAATGVPSPRRYIFDTSRSSITVDAPCFARLRLVQWRLGHRLRRPS